MARPVTEQNKLPAASVPWARQVTDVLNSLATKVDNFINDQTNRNRNANANTQTLGTQVSNIAAAQDTLAAQQVTLASQQATLQAASTSRSDSTSSGGTVSSVGYYTGSRPSVTINVPTGRLEIQFGGSMNSGNAYFVFSATGSGGTVYVARDDMRDDVSRRLAISGGASFTPSTYATQIINVTPGDNVTVTLQFYAATAGAYFAGGSILARPTF